MNNENIYFCIGIYDPEQRIFTLNFRGLSFTFPVEQASEPRYTNKGLGSLQFSNGASPVASKMFIFNGNSLIESKPPPLPISCFFSHPYLQWLEVIRHKGSTAGVRLSIICEGNNLINLFAERDSLMHIILPLIDDMLFSIRVASISSTGATPTNNCC